MSESKNNKHLILKIIAAVSYIAMVIVNYFSGSVGINNTTAGEVSDAYSNLFAPAGFTFSIWGLIYLLLAGFLVYQFLPSGKKKSDKNETLLQKINILFIATSLANMVWIFTWHYNFLGLSVIIMAALLMLLIKIIDTLQLEKLTSKEKTWISLPFSVYFGWITVATIANVTTFLVSVGWNGFGIPDFIWTSIILIVGAVIGVLRMQKDKNIAYGLVLIWAYFGILSKHLSDSGFSGQYPSVVVTVLACLLFFAFFTVRIFIANRKN